MQRDEALCRVPHPALVLLGADRFQNRVGRNGTSATPHFPQPSVRYDPLEEPMLSLKRRKNTEPLGLL
jgi:hypothetical protein